MTDRPPLPQELKDAIADKIGNLEKAAIQLRDLSVLREGAELLKEYFSIVFRLGSIEHEVALVKLEKQIEKASLYAKTSRTDLGKRLPSVLKSRNSEEFDNLMTETLALIDEALAMESSGHDEETRKSLSKMHHSVESLSSDDGALELKINRALFAFRAGMHVRVYTLLALQQVVAWLGRHAFIVFASVLVLGMGYSWLVRESQSLLGNLFSLGIWALLTIGLVFLMFKQTCLHHDLERCNAELSDGCCFLLPAASTSRTFKECCQCCPKQSIGRLPVLQKNRPIQTTASRYHPALWRASDLHGGHKPGSKISRDHAGLLDGAESRSTR